MPTYGGGILFIDDHLMNVGKAFSVGRAMYSMLTIMESVAGVLERGRKTVK